MRTARKKATRLTPTRENTCAVVITFNPDREFAARLPLLNRQADKLIVIDNGSDPGIRQAIQSCALQLDADLIQNRVNIGVAAALNQGIEKVRALGYTWALFFDHDSEPTCKMHDVFSGIYQSHPDQERIAVIGARYIDPNRSEPAAADPGTDAEWTEKKTVITSGCLVSLDAYRVIGPFREEFFIDMVDREYCFRARSKGYIVIQSVKPLIMHTIGSFTHHRRFGRTIWMSNHSAVRRYFMTRNRLLVHREYGQVPALWRLRSLIGVLRRILNVLFYEDDRAGKARAMMTGWWHGIRGITIPPAWIREQLGYTWQDAQ